MSAAPAYRVIAHNYAHDSENKIHSDDVASQFGFKGGLVPGVADYAYLARAVYDRWGERWLREGSMEAKFIKPVYDGEAAAAHLREGEDGALELELLNPAGELCAAGRAALGAGGEAPRVEDYERRDTPGAQARCPPAVAALPGGFVLGAYEYRFDGEAAEVEAQSHFVEALPAGADGRAPWHPALCLHDANRILRANVDLGPWIHTASAVHYFDAPRDGELVSLRGSVVDTYEKRGHVMTELDLAMFALPADSAGPARALARIRHRAIVRLRPA